MFLIILLVNCLCGLPLALGGLTLSGVQCGQKTCKMLEYCSDIDRTCQPCARICDKNTHNFEPGLCMSACQDYIHDLRYVSKDSPGNDENLTLTVQRLSKMVTVTLTMVIFILLALAGILCFQLLRWKKKKNITWRSIKNNFFPKRVNRGDPEVTPNTNDEKKSDIPISGSHSDHSPGTMTTSISRRPAEDSTLNYAYDNPAMRSPSSPARSSNGRF